MALPKDKSLRIVSKGYDLRRQKEVESRAPVRIEDIIDKTGLAKGTVRRWVADADGDVTGSPLLAAAIIADYFGVPLEALLRVERVRVEEGERVPA